MKYRVTRCPGKSTSTWSVSTKSTTTSTICRFRWRSRSRHIRYVRTLIWCARASASSPARPRNRSDRRLLYSQRARPAMTMSYKHAYNIEDLHRMAKRRLPRVAYDYLAGGAEDDVTLTQNRAAFERIRLRPRTLVDVSRRAQRVSVFGKTFESPFGLAPTGAAGLYGFAADIALAH